MEKELKNLLDNYENVIYGQAFLINPSIHQLHLLLDYIANLEQQCKKQKEVNDKAVKYINQHWVIDDPVLFKNDLLEILENKEVK